MTSVRIYFCSIKIQFNRSSIKVTKRVLGSTLQNILLVIE